MGTEPKLVDIEVYIVAETDRAYKVDPNGNFETAVWIPKSQCEFDPGIPATWGTLTLPEWIAKRESLI